MVISRCGHYLVFLAVLLTISIFPNKSYSEGQQRYYYVYSISALPFLGDAINRDACNDLVFLDSRSVAEACHNALPASVFFVEEFEGGSTEWEYHKLPMTPESNNTFYSSKRNGVEGRQYSVNVDIRSLLCDRTPSRIDGVMTCPQIPSCVAGETLKDFTWFGSASDTRVHHLGCDYYAHPAMCVAGICFGDLVGVGEESATSDTPGVGASGQQDQYCATGASGRTVCVDKGGYGEYDGTPFTPTNPGSDDCKVSGDNWICKGNPTNPPKDKDDNPLPPKDQWTTGGGAGGPPNNYSGGDGATIGGGDGGGGGPLPGNGDGDGDGDGECEGDDCDEGGSSWSGGICEHGHVEPPSCQHKQDPVQCAIALEQWVSRCNADLRHRDTFGTPEWRADADGVSLLDPTHEGNTIQEVEIDLSDHFDGFDGGGFLPGGDCPVYSANVLGYQLELNLTPVCDLAETIGLVILACAYFWAGRIFLDGVT